MFFGLSFLFNLWLAVALFVRPMSFWKVYDWQRNARPDLHDDTTYEGFVFFLPFIMLVVFGCGSALYCMVGRKCCRVMREAKSLTCLGIENKSGDKLVAVTELLLRRTQPQPIKCLNNSPQRRSRPNP